MLASFVCPTFNRPHKHAALYAGFCADQYEPRELVVLDGSKDPSPFFTVLKDDRVRYVHEPEAPREQGVTRIGAVRNRLTELARGEVLVAVDDDDLYSPEWATEMIRRLGDADCARLAVWRIEHNGDLYLWDQRIIGGPAYAIRGDIVEPTDTDGMTPEEATAFRDAWMLGFMWSAVFKRSVALEIPFPEEGTEDVPWMRALVAAGKKIVQVADAPHLALHVVEPNPAHAEGGSPHFPQVKLRAAAAKRMMGAGISRMDELPQGQSIRVEPGKTYNVLAAIRASHTVKSIATRAAHWGLQLQESRDNVAPEEFGVAAPPDGYRLVYFSGVGDKDVTIPWSAPRMLRAIGEKSGVVKAWIGAGALADEDDAWIVRAFVGAGAPSDVEYVPVDQPKPHPSGHVCSAASSQTVARQLDPRWTYAGMISRAERDKLPIVRRVIESPAGGKKDVPTWTDNAVLVLQCPYSGELFRFTLGSPQLGAGQSNDLLGLQSLSQQIPGQIPTDLQKQWQEQLAYQNSSGEDSAVYAMLRLIEKGSFDPNNPADMQATIDITAGALTAAGLPEIGAAVELLDAGAHALAAALLKLGILPSPPPCVHTGPPTPPQDILTGWGWPPNGGAFGLVPASPSAFGQIIVPILARVTADLFNCNAQWPANQIIVQAVADLWNKAGNAATVPSPAVSVFVPTYAGSLDSAMIFQGAQYGGRFAASMPWAFQPLSTVPSGVLEADANLTPIPPMNLSLNAGPDLKKKPPKPPPPPHRRKTFHPAIVAAGVVVGTAAVAAAGVGVWAWATDQAYSEAWRRVWDAVVGESKASGGLLLGAGTR